MTEQCIRCKCPRDDSTSETKVYCEKCERELREAVLRKVNGNKKA